MKLATTQECHQCLYRSTHPFGLTFNSSGICSGCVTHSEKTSLDWEIRFDLLRDKFKQHRTRKNGNYDCVVPVRGTPEYFYVLDVLKNKLGLNPLVVSYNNHFNSEVGIANIDRIRESFDVDFIQYTSNPMVYRKLMRESLVRFNSMRWPFIAGETSFPVQIAAEYDIPIVVWPYHQPTEQVGMHSYTESVEMSARGRHEFDLMGYEPTDLLTSETLLNPTDVADVLYPSFRTLEKKKIIGIYLSNYLPWDTRLYSEEMIIKFQAKSAVNIRTFDTYDRIDDMTYMGIHDLLKFKLLSYSRVTDNLCREIRFGRVRKDDARVIEMFYQAQLASTEIQRFSRWLGLSHLTLDWFIQFMPNSAPISLPSLPVILSPKQQQFIDGFISNTSPVHNAKDYTIYGKGLDNFGDETASPISSSWRIINRYA